MLNDNARRWVAVLRSDEYSQQTGRLRGDDSFCCMGVACDLYRQEVEGEWDDFQCSKTGYMLFRWGNHGSISAYLPYPVVKWLGLASSDGAFVVSSHDGLRNRYSLVNMNDNGSSFNKIANVIESEPENMFV